MRRVERIGEAVVALAEETMVIVEEWKEEEKIEGPFVPRRVIGRPGDRDEVHSYLSSPSAYSTSTSSPPAPSPSWYSDLSPHCEVEEMASPMCLPFSPCRPLPMAPPGEMGKRTMSEKEIFELEGRNWVTLSTTELNIARSDGLQYWSWTPDLGSRVSEVSSLLGRAGTVGLGKAVEVLDTLGSIMTNLNMSAGFISGVTMKGNKISILSFEVANTIVKGSNLMQSLSKESIKHLKEVVLPSEGVQRLISKDTDELLRIAAADKRDELKVFSGEVVRFGNRCKDPQWHNLNRYFEKLGSELTPQKQLKEDAEVTMQQLMTMVQYTAELYHELHALDRFEQDYKRKQQEESSNSAQRGDNLQILRQELKSQKKHVKNLKKKSLWSRILEEVMEKLVDIVHFLHLEIHEAFGSADSDTPLGGSFGTHQRLGSAGLALHYANVISQIDTLVSRSSSIPPNTRDTLYQGLPPSIKSALRSRLQAFQIKEELTVAQIKDEMEKTLRWLVPIANNTTKAHHGFGWVGEWANTGSELSRKQAGQTDLIRIETLHHADKNKTEAYILDLVVWLHHLVSQSRAGNGIRSPIKSPIRSPINQPSSNRPSAPSPTLSQEDKEMLREVYYRRLTPGISKSQEFGPSRRSLSKHNRLSKSISYSPHSGGDRDLASPPARRPSMLPVINFDIDRNKALDVIDRLDGLRS